jgi:hypothetical protein
VGGDVVVDEAGKETAEEPEGAEVSQRFGTSLERRVLELRVGLVPL